MLSIGELGIDLVGEDHDTGVPQHLGHGLQVLALHDAAGGVVGEGQHQHLGPGGDGRAQLLGGEAEFILRLGLHIDGGAAGHGGQRPVADKGGDGNDDLIPRIDHAAQGQVDGLAAAHGDNDLMGKVVLEMEAAVQIGRNLPAQLGHAGVGGVLCKSLFQGVDARVPDVPGRDKVRLADSQRDCVLHLLQDVKEPADSRRFDVLDALGQNGIIVHEKISSLSCSSCFLKIRCFSLYFFRMKWVAVPVTPSSGARRWPTNWATSFSVRPEMMTVRS